MMASRSFCGMSPCMALTVKLFCRIFSVSQSTFRLVLQKMTACGEQAKDSQIACSMLRMTACKEQHAAVTHDI